MKTTLLSPACLRSSLAWGSMMLLTSTIVSAKPSAPNGNPFDIVDPQDWVNPDDMTWDDYVKPPGTSWNDPSVRGSERNFNIALIAVDYDDMDFVVTLAPNSTVFGNPSASAANIKREDVPTHYRDLLNKPGGLNLGRTIHEYWMEDSAGKYGVDLTAFGPYRMSNLQFQYGITEQFNPGACPEGYTCDLNFRAEALAEWRNDVGNETADAFELVFVLSAGQDETSSWQEFGEMKFASKEDIPDAWGPPAGVDGDGSLPNYAATRYVEWTAWASAATVWPAAGDGSSMQCESSGMATYAHELSHLLDIGDNYNNPFGNPPRRSYTGPWSMLSRGSFNGPGGPHTRWQIPSLQGGTLGSLHTIRDKLQLGLITEDNVVKVSRETLADTGLVTAQLTARSVDAKLLGLRIEMNEDLSPSCDTEEDPLCDGGGFQSYDVEVIDRMGADSFQPDSGVMISKSKASDEDQPFQWTIDANPEDIELVDFVRPNGTKAMITIGDYRQLADALFHAGTRSGSTFEYVDKANRLHFYVLEKQRAKNGVLSYTVGVRSLDGASKTVFGTKLAKGRTVKSKTQAPTTSGVLCSFDLTNNGTYRADAKHDKLAGHVGSDAYRLSAEVSGKGWHIAVPSAVIVAKFGETVSANVAVKADKGAASKGTVKLMVTSESDPDAVALAECVVKKA